MRRSFLHNFAPIDSSPRLVHEDGTQSVQREEAWWIANRAHTALFSQQLTQALKILATLPGAGSPYAESSIPDVRRLYLRKLGLHIYYSFTANEVIVRALWGARREHGPVLVD